MCVCVCMCVDSCEEQLETARTERVNEVSEVKAREAMTRRSDDDDENRRKSREMYA